MIALHSSHILLKLVVFPHHFFSQNRRDFIIEYLLIVNRFIPKSATRLTAGLASTAIATLFIDFFLSNQSDRPFGMSQKARSPFWLRMFLQGSAIAFMYTRCQTCEIPFGISQKVRSPFWYGKVDRTTQSS